MRAWAEEDGTAFPPRDYWKSVAEPSKLRYRTIPRRDYARERMNGIPVDDDLQYTLLGLLILEDFGPGFTTEDVARAWQTYLPFACTAEDVALTNLRRGVPALQAADPDGVAPAAQACFMSEDRAHGSAGAVANPYNQWIGADIRADPWGYVAPGWPGSCAGLWRRRRSRRSLLQRRSRSKPRSDTPRCRKKRSSRRCGRYQRSGARPVLVMNSVCSCCFRRAREAAPATAFPPAAMTRAKTTMIPRSVSQRECTAQDSPSARRCSRSGMVVVGARGRVCFAVSVAECLRRAAPRSYT
jgi:hypothetical protein